MELLLEEGTGLAPVCETAFAIGEWEMGSDDGCCLKAFQECGQWA
jgi:hypothetical protein